MPRKNGTKADAIREAIRQLGGPNQAKNPEVVELVGKQGFKTSGNEVSMYKTKLRRSAGASTANGASVRKPRRRPGRKPGRPAMARNGGGGLSVADIQTVRAVIARLGASQVKELVDALA